MCATSLTTNESLVKNVSNRNWIFLSKNEGGHFGQHLAYLFVIFNYLRINIPLIPSY